MNLRKTWAIYAAVLIGSIFIAARFPITNDESYYIAFAKHLQLSYVDGPPFVSYLNILQLKLGWDSSLASRSFVIILHVISTLFLMAIVYNNVAHDETLQKKLLLTFLLSYLTPIFGVYGLFILPDSGLILSLSLLIWTTDNILRANEIAWKNVLIIGIALGIGLLSKYHIFPLGGGILLGLLIELSLRSRFKIANFVKLFASGIIGLICALPLFIWNFENHYASFVFQFEHGFSAHQFQIGTVLAFIFGALAYLTPWFAFVLLKRGLFSKRNWALIIPTTSLFIILLISSLSNKVLPHWIAPAFWLLIPFAIIHLEGPLKPLMTLCKFTAVPWLLFIAILALPGGITNIERTDQLINPEHPNLDAFKDLLLWQDLPGLIKNHPLLNNTINTALNEKQPPACSEQRPIVAVDRWFWASQSEYHHIFPGAKILNLDQGASSFYLWRDHWADDANCRVLVVAEADNPEQIGVSNLITLDNNPLIVRGLSDYRSLHLVLVSGTFKDAATLEGVQNNLINHPHY